MARGAREPYFEVQSSAIAGEGAFALRRIRRGTRIVEYLGERISEQESDRRYGEDPAELPHVLLFRVDDDTVLDAAVGGNDARFINHSCDPNCEPVVDQGRVFIAAIKTIQPGEELSYDYRLERGESFDPQDERRYLCRCGAANCRGTMLEPAKP